MHSEFNAERMQSAECRVESSLVGVERVGPSQRGGVGGGRNGMGQHGNREMRLVTQFARRGSLQN